MQTDVQKFFQGLGDRFWKENNLSDVTYAMCRGSKVFFQFFLDFFFSGELALDAEDAEIAREVDDGKGNRPDFRIETRKGIFYIEVKIWDRWQHFPEYFKSLQKANPEDGGNEEKTRKRLGYIVNYSLAVDGYVVHRWEELVEQLKRYDYFNDDAIQGYAEFVKSVCGLRGNDDVDSYRFHSEDFRDIRRFMDDVESAIGTHKDQGVSPYNRNQVKRFQQNLKMGKVFELANFRGTNKSVWGWLGCFFNEARAEIVVQFENQCGWGDLVCQEYKAPHKQERSVYYDDYDNALYFYMVETDKDINDFFGRVLLAIQGSYDQTTIPAFPSEKQFEKYKYLLSMRRFPKAVQKRLFDEEENWGKGRWIETLGQDDWPYSQIHVRFQVHMEREGGDMTKEGWIGVEYGRDGATHELLVPKCCFAFDGEPTSEIVSPGEGEDLRAWASEARQQLIAKFDEWESRRDMPGLGCDGRGEESL